MPPPTTLVLTTYAELLERCATAAFGEAFEGDGVFTSKTQRGRRYWYFQASTADGRKQRYVGPESDELLARIARHREARNDEKERRALVSTLVRSFRLPRPAHEIGRITHALARAGVFRLRSVVVGTVAYQTYSAMFGTRLSPFATDDLDIAQFENISVAMDDETPPVLDILKRADPTFRPVPHVTDRTRTSTYQAKGGIRVDFLTPNEGAESDQPRALPALQTDAQPLRFLDFLIHDPEPAVVLHEAGIYVLVPRPERYAIHKLMIAQRRRTGAAKREKDIEQAASLLDVLCERRSAELKSAWEEADSRGSTWKRLLRDGMTQLPTEIRDRTLKAIGAAREILPELELTFQNPPARYVFDRDIVAFDGFANKELVRCAISREALDDHFGADGLSQQGRVEKFLENRNAIELMTRKKYLSWPVEEADSVLIRTSEVPALRKSIDTGARRPADKRRRRTK